MKIKEFPFLNGAGVSVPKDRKEDVAAIRSWLSHQPHLPKITDEHILLFLHSNYYSVERTKNTIDAYFVVRAENPDLFGKWDLDTLKPTYDLYEMAPVKKLTSEGYRILVYRLKETDPSKMNFLEAMRCFFAFNDVVISEDGLINGYIVIFDMKGCSLGHLARVTTMMNLVRIFMIYIQECHPVRLKGVHVINTASFMDKILSLIKPLMQSELVQMLHLHGSVASLNEHGIALDVLPEDYGGDSKPTTHLYEEHMKVMQKKYKSWLKDSSTLIADLKKRPQKSKDTTMEGSFRSLSID